ncbi:glutamic acid-rich protein-like [Galleria mellonella]|uniref:Glutamic acid-rich protein-like n=1 Tax=Galleria mellonella TaxID=7137 RepID=A0A6J3BUA1_GALME|nr:glutamic acid-rich protein-like [Galleria mellonella]
MLLRVSFFLWLSINIDCLSLDKVSDTQNVTKRAINNGDFYPDWVPFKNKHGDQLGEFVQVEPKAKPKKRLALPVNFKLKAVAESEVDDYYDKGKGEGDSDDEFEKKEWSDLNRPDELVDPGQSINHTDISDIDGVVKIITKIKPNVLAETIKSLTKSRDRLLANNKTEEGMSEYAKEKSSEESNNEEDKDNESESTKENPIHLNKDEIKIVPKDNKDQDKSEVLNKEEKVPRKEEDDVDYEDGISEKRKKDSESEDERRENEARKAMILGSVDELKARHEKEQKAISERIKEEELYKEEHERDQIRSKEEIDKYGNRKHKITEYDEYEDKDSTEDERYKPTTTTTVRPRRITRRKPKNKNMEHGKLSVFKNPRAYMLFDETDENIETTTQLTKTTNVKHSRFSSRYRAPTEKDEHVRISLVPEEIDPKEPTLFFPQKKKNKRRRKQKTTTTPSSDSTVAETVGNTAKDSITEYADTTASDTVTSAVDTAPSAIESAPSAIESAPSAVDTVSVNSNSVKDAVPASTDKKEEHKSEDYDREKGGTREYKSEHYEEHDEHGKKAYEGIHKDTKSAKGHHDTEDHLGKYNDHGGIDKHHHDEDGHYGSHHHEEHGKKHAKYEESGKHSKGHSTKGSHDIHKKEEYEKKVEFFEEEGDSAEEEKHGGYAKEKEHSSGGHFKHGNLKAGHHEHSKGDTGHFHKGGHGHKEKGHKAAQGHDSHGKHGNAQFEKGGKNTGKKWVYHHGYPAKNANLVIIDRRADQYYHGPQYYG